MQQNYLLNSLHNFYRKSILPAFVTYGDVNLGEAIADKLNIIYNEEIEKLKEFTCCEVGPGKGLVSKGFVNRLRKNHPKIYRKLSLVLIDISKRNLESTKTNLSQHKEKIDFICADADNLPLKTESIDFLYSNELLDALPFELYQRVGNEWYLTDYKKNNESILVRENSQNKDRTKRSANTISISQQHLGPPRLKRFIRPSNIKKSDIEIRSQREHSYLNPIGIQQFLIELYRIMKKGSYAMHIDYFSKNPYEHNLRLYLPNATQKIEVNLQDKKGKLNPVMIPEDFMDMFDVTFNVPINLVKKHSQALKFNVETFSPQGLAFKDTKKGKEKCVFVGDLQNLLNCFSLPQVLREKIKSEKLFDIAQIKQMIDQNYSFYVPLESLKDKTNNSFYNTLRKFALPYWFGISIKKIPEVRTKISYDKIPDDLALKYMTLIFRKE